MPNDQTRIVRMFGTVTQEGDLLGSNHSVELNTGETFTLVQLVDELSKLREVRSPGAVERAVNRANHAHELMRTEQRRAAMLDVQLGVSKNDVANLEHNIGRLSAQSHGRLVEARRWKQRAIAAERNVEKLLAACDELTEHIKEHSDAVGQLKIERNLREQAQQHALTAQANALEVILQIAKQLPEPVVDAEIIEPALGIETYFDKDDTSVVNINTRTHPGPIRVKLNDATIWGSDSIYKAPRQNSNVTISRQLDTIREQAEQIEQLMDERDDAIGRSLARQESIEALQSECDALSLQNSSQLDTIREQIEQIETLKRELHETPDKPRIAELRRRVAEKERELEHLRSLARVNTASFRALEAKITELEGERETAAETISRLNARLAHARRDLDAARTDRDARKAEHAESVAGFNEQLAALAAANLARDNLASITLNKARTLMSFYRAKSDAERSLLGGSFTNALRELLAEFPELREELNTLPAASKYISAGDLLPHESIVAQHAALAHAAMKLARAVLSAPFSEYQRKLAQAIHDNETHQLMLLPQDQDQNTELELAALTESVRKVLTKEPAFMGSYRQFRESLRELRATYEAQMGANPERTDCS